MLTPAFELSQDKEFLTIFIKAPFAKISETEIFAEETDFKFFSKPYFLRLTLPGNVIEDGREHADYDSHKGVFTIKFPKETLGEHFEGLDMITKLLAPKGKTSAAPPLIQVIDTDAAAASTDGGAEDQQDEEEYDWCVEQTPYTEQPTLLDAPKYGFANQKSGVFQRLQEELCGVVDSPDPDNLTIAERREKRLHAESSKFDEDHYIADLYGDELIQPLLSYRPLWLEEFDVVQKGTPVELAVELTDDEKDAMRKIPNKEYVLDQSEETAVYLGLVDLMFAYAYNHRTTEGENNVESGWTICKISGTLSWLEVYSNIRDVVVSCVRRSLCYPLYRHWKLTMAVLNDVIHIFKLGRRRLLRCLLEMRGQLLDEESRYILNDLYITDYCVWIQGASPKRLQSLAEALEKVVITKDGVGFDLLEVERVAEIAMKDDSDEDVEHVTSKLSKIIVNNDKTHRDSDDESTNSETDTTETDDASESDDIKTDPDDDMVDAAGGAICKGAKVCDATLETRRSKEQTNKIMDEMNGNDKSEDLIAKITAEDMGSADSKVTSKRCKPLITEIGDDKK